MPPEVEQSLGSMKQQQQQQQKSTSKLTLRPNKRTLVPVSPSKLKIYPVSKLDSILGNFYLHTVLYFDRSSMGLSKGSWESDMDLLNLSFSNVLDFFPVLSGRLRVLENGNLGIKSNDSGVRLTEAACSSSLKDWLDESDGSLRHQMIPDICITDYNVSPLCTVQYTNFRCGSLAIGVSWCHVVADLMSMDHLLKLWGEAHRNGGRVRCPSPSFTADQSDGSHRHLPEPFDARVGKDIGIPGQLDSRVFHLSSKSVENLMHDSGAPEVEAVCALVWRSAVKAQGRGESGTTSRLCMWMNSPKMDCKCFGNAATEFKLVDAEDVESRSGEELARILQVGGKTSKGPSSFFSKNVLFCNWSANVPLFETEFGFSHPLYVESFATSMLGEGMVTVAPGFRGGRSKSVCVSLEKDAMKRLLQDGEFARATGPVQKVSLCTAATISAPAA